MKFQRDRVHCKEMGLPRRRPYFFESFRTKETYRYG